MNPGVSKGSFAIDQGLASCSCCGKLSPQEVEHCPRCGKRLHLRKPQSLARTLSLLVAAIAFYIPAMALPVMIVDGVGTSSAGGSTGGSTIIGGVITFWKSGSYPVAIIIFTASVLIPILKIVSLCWLCLAATGRAAGSPHSHALAYHITELVGRWSMVDVFVVAILVCLVRLGNLMTITPGPAAISFATVVILTMLSAMSFDPRLLWDHQRRTA
ncbi:paraquat-inducible protein A [Haloferula luteola]|uniref:Paraquat-inducible protein A n=1 Tax=Haloferula luteola TaxID=595692 RepID=A0A840V7Q8_9BACT|nr:paraquat-inducible protein A [Haloferula luteola]MBB5349990.1 paraquat-inducible protein A [Haloferula luteola]